MSGTKALLIVGGIVGLLFATVLAMAPLYDGGLPCGTAFTSDPPEDCSSTTSDQQAKAVVAAILGGLLLTIGLMHQDDGKLPLISRDPDEEHQP